MNQLLIVRILLIGIGSILILMLAVLLTRTIQFIKRSSRTTGKIKELILSNRRKGLVRPTIEFHLPSGKVVVFRSRSTHSKSAYDVDEEVPVRYDRAFPQDARIDSFLHLWAVPCLLLFFGALIVWAGMTVTADFLPPAGTPQTAEEDPYKYYLHFWIGPLLFFAFALAALSMGLWNTWKMIATMFWPATTGRVVNARVRSSGGFFAPEITYSFEVDNITHESSKFDAAECETEDETEPERIAGLYQKGATVAVYYNPRNPSDAVLRKGINVGLLLMMFGAALGFGFVGWIMWVGSREGWLY